MTGEADEQAGGLAGVQLRGVADRIGQAERAAATAIGLRTSVSMVTMWDEFGIFRR